MPRLIRKLLIVSALEAVVQARAKATSIEITPELVNDPKALQQFMDAQGQLTSALSRLFSRD